MDTNCIKCERSIVDPLIPIPLQGCDHVVCIECAAKEYNKMFSNAYDQVIYCIKCSQERMPSKQHALALQGYVRSTRSDIDTDLQTQEYLCAEHPS